MAAGLYPQEANLYDSLGELYLKKGNKEKRCSITRRHSRSIRTFPTPPPLARL